MKLSKLLIIVIATSAFLFTACSTEEDDSLTRHEMVFQISMGNNETRATIDDTWTVGDTVAVRVGTTVKKYVVATTNGDVQGADKANNTFYWEDLGGSSVEVTAWSFGKRYVETLDGLVTIFEDQSSDANFVGSDFLYATPTVITRESSLNSLQFYHQMALMNINIKLDDPSNGIKDVLIGYDPYSVNYGGSGAISIIGAPFNVPTKDVDTQEYPKYGEFDTYDGDNLEYGTIIPHQKETAEDGFTASYSAVMIPFGYESFIITLRLSDNTEFSFTPVYAEFIAGTRVNYNITVNNGELSVDVGNNSGEAAGSLDPVTVNNWRLVQ